VNCVLVGGDGWESPSLLPSAGTALEGCYFGIHYNVEDADSKTRDFVKAFKAKFTGDKAKHLNSMAALGYDAIYVLKAALEKSKSGSRKALRDALAGIKGFAGASDKFDITAGRDARKAITMVKIEGNDWKFAKKIKPEDVE
jgi:branched-chain amino acid transport system substrate-binding protein